MTITQSLIEQALQSQGWAAFEGLGERAAADKKRQDEQERTEAAIVHAALSTPEGEKFVLWLMQKTLLRSPGDAELGARTAEAYAIAKARREGQNQIVFTILTALEKARDGN